MSQRTNWAVAAVADDVGEDLLALGRVEVGERHESAPLSPNWAAAAPMPEAAR